METSDEMVAAACKRFFGERWTFVEAEAMHEALDAALAVAGHDDTLTADERTVLAATCDVLEARGFAAGAALVRRLSQRRACAGGAR